MRRLLWVCAVLLGVLPTLGAQAEIKAEMYAGLAGAYRGGTFTPVTVTLENKDAPVEGVLRVTFRDTSGARGAYEKAVRLPTGSRKRVTLYPRPGPSVPRITISFVDSAGKVLFEQEERLVTLDNHLRIIGYIGTPSSGNPGIRALARQRTRVLVLEPEELPDSAAGYQTLDALILREPDLTKFGPARLEAMREWVAAGGTLVVAVATRAADISASPTFEALLPARLGTLQTAQAERTGLVGAGSDEARTSVPMVELSKIRGRSVWGGSGDSVAIAGEYGAGRVAVVGFDPASVKALDTKKVVLWERLLDVSLPPEPPNLNAVGGYYTGYNTDPRTLILTHVGEMPPLKPPPMALMILLLALYVFAVGPGDYLLLKKLGKLQWTWFTYPATILIFSGAVYGYAKFSRSERVEVKGVAVVDLPAQAVDVPAPARAIVGIYAPTGDDYVVTVRSKGAQASVFTADQTSIAGMAWQLAKNQEWVSKSDPNQASVSLPVPQWSFGAAEVIGTADKSPQLTAQLNGSSIAVTHGGGDEVIGLAVVERGYIRVFERPMKPGQTESLKRPNNSDTPLSQVSPYDTSYGYYNNSGPGQAQTNAEIIRKALMRVAFAGDLPPAEYALPQGGTKKIERERGTPFLERSPRQKGQPVVLAVVDGAPFDIDVAGQQDRGMLTIYRVPVQRP